MDYSLENIVKVEKEKLLQFISANNLGVDIDKIAKAVDFAAYAHRHQKRASGEPYILHPIAVAMLIAELNLDTVSIVVALLHDVVEDSEYTLEDIVNNFGSKEAELVDGVTKLTKLESQVLDVEQAKQIKQADNLRKLIVAMSKDIRVLLVKLADRLHNMRTLFFFSNASKKERIAKETIEIYAPLAERIGLQRFKNELQDLAFAELYPEAYKSIVNRLNFLGEQGKLVIEKNILEIRALLESNNIKAEVTGREKSPHSIWRKMEHKKISFEELSDIFAFRILVNNVEDCYKVIGVIHTKYHMLPGAFQDYISTPKTNHYRSLHTLVMGPQKRCIEIQIRTYEMHQVAELGVAAHWLYKQGKEFDEYCYKQNQWVKKLHEVIENSLHPDEVLENTKLEIDYNQVFCFTPKGDIIALPKSATPVDFAFALHSEIGLTCMGAKVNGKIVPLKASLENGDQVEILRSSNTTASINWESFVVTGKAKAEIKKFVRAQQQEEFISLGRVMLASLFQKLKYEYSEVDFLKILPDLKKESVDELLADVGRGNLSTEVVINTLYPETRKSQIVKKLNPLSLLRFKRKSKSSIYKNELSLDFNVENSDNNATVRLADCCCPLPGDKIVGLLTPDKGMVVHTGDCESITNLNKEDKNLIAVFWSASGNKLYIGRIKIIIVNEPGSLALVTSKIAEIGINISNIKFLVRSLDFFEIVMELEIKGLQHLKSLKNTLKSLDNVYAVDRLR